MRTFLVRECNVPFWSVAVNTFLVHHSFSMKQTDPQYKLRLPQELKDQVEEAAKQSGRSMNAEIVARLEQSFTEPLSTERSAHSDIADLVKQQKLFHIETLELQLTTIENELSRLHNPLADAHRNLDGAKAAGNATEIKKFTDEADRLKRAMTKLDERYESCIARLAVLRKELKQVTASTSKN